MSVLDVSYLCLKTFKSVIESNTWISLVLGLISCCLYMLRGTFYSVTLIHLTIKTGSDLRI